MSNIRALGIVILHNKTVNINYVLLFKLSGPNIGLFKPRAMICVTFVNGRSSIEDSNKEI
jgi:hypothetical protein